MGHQLQSIPMQHPLAQPYPSPLKEAGGGEIQGHPAGRDVKVPEGTADTQCSRLVVMAQKDSSLSGRQGGGQTQHHLYHRVGEFPLQDLPRRVQLGWKLVHQDV